MENCKKNSNAHDSFFKLNEYNNAPVNKREKINDVIGYSKDEIESISSIKFNMKTHFITCE